MQNIEGGLTDGKKLLIADLLIADLRLAVRSARRLGAVQNIEGGLTDGKKLLIADLLIADLNTNADGLRLMAHG